jgi:hypothetical protein
MLAFIRFVAAIAVMMFLGFALGASVGERNWFGPWPFAIAFGAVGAWIAVAVFGWSRDEATRNDPL